MELFTKKRKIVHLMPSQQQQQIPLNKNCLFVKLDHIVNTYHNAPKVKTIT